MIGEKNETLKRIGVSKHRLMAGGSRNCVVCDKPLDKAAGDSNHKCVEHADWELIVVDGPNDEAIRQASIARLRGHENDTPLA